MIAGELTRNQGRSLLRRANTDVLVTRFRMLSYDERVKVYQLANEEEQQLWKRDYQRAVFNLRAQSRLHDRALIP